MAEFHKTELILNHRFDTKTKRHFLNDFVTVLHCHHYTTLYTQLALDANETDLLAEVSEETFYAVLSEYFEEYNIEDLEDMISIAEQYYAAVGLGNLKVNFLGDHSGEAELHTSHLEKGWIKKWGQYDRPVNYITAGYITAVFELVLDEPLGTFMATEISSIVTGDKTTVFKVSKI